MSESIRGGPETEIKKTKKTAKKDHSYPNQYTKKKGLRRDREENKKKNVKTNRRPVTASQSTKTKKFGCRNPTIGLTPRSAPNNIKTS